MSAFALDTSDGIIVFDALNSTAEAHDLLVPNMVALGLDPERIQRDHEAAFDSRAQSAS